MFSKLLTTRISKWFFSEYFGIPKDKEIFRLTSNAVHYWEDKAQGIAKCRQFQKNLWDIPVIERTKKLAILAGALVFKPIAFILAVDTASVNNKDTNIREEVATTNYGTNTFLTLGKYDAGQTHNALLNFTLSAGTGTVTDVKLNLYRLDSLGWSQNGNSAAFNAHSITQAGWTETGATWNKYDGTTNWAVAGGDYNGTIIDNGAATSDATWMTLVLMGTGATNPLTLTWGSVIDIFIKDSTGVVNRALGTPSKEYTTDTSKRPYIEITYSAAAIKTVNGLSTT